jgi:hypothetical protein
MGIEAYLEIDRLSGVVVIVPAYSSRGPRYDSWRYRTLGQVVGLEQGPPNLLSTTEELPKRKSSGSGPESRD